LKDNQIIDSSTLLNLDSRLAATNLRCTTNPQQLIWLAAHQDVSEHYIIDKIETTPNESNSGKFIVKHLLTKKHFGPLEHPSISIAIGNYPHSTMQQLSRHRLQSIDCQSMRYTGDRVLKVADGELDIEDLIYLRPAGIYTSRTGNYEYTNLDRRRDLNLARVACALYAEKVKFSGIHYEHARGMLPFDFRQCWVSTFNCRALLHVLDERLKKDAQLEIQALSTQLFALLKVWTPDIAEWYEKTRYSKGVTAP
jgi:thymidylate synthase (FAD)